MITGRRRATESPLRRGNRAASGGFTLVEVMLVLTLLVIIGSLAWPQLNSAFDSRRLRAAADQLRADITRARVAAMESGRAHAMHVDPASGRYAVSPLDDLSDSDPFSLPAVGGGMQAAPIFEGILPEEIRMLSLTAMDDVKPPPAVGGAAFDPAAGAVTGATSAPSGGFSVVYFHPDGTTSSAAAILAGESELFVEVSLRGLTGGTSVGEVFAGDEPSTGGRAADAAPAGATP